MEGVGGKFAFSQAGGTIDNRYHTVRPLGDILGGECAEEKIEEEELVEDTEARTIKGQPKVVKPSVQEWEDHMRTHIPYRKWCPHCVGGKRKAGEHSSTSDEIKENEEVPVISFDYMTQKSKEMRKIEENRKKLKEAMEEMEEDEDEEKYTFDQKYQFGADHIPTID